jgi:hypothetical protein
MESAFVPSARILAVEWSHLYVIFQWVMPVLSLAFLGMGVVRYFRDGMSDPCKRLARRSFIAYAVHPLAFTLGLFTMNLLDHVLRPSRSLESVIFLAMMLLPSSLLLASIYYGFRSGSAAGRRIALASICVIVAVLAGDLFLLNLLTGKMAV